tara:strand:- start:328 stop:768 length:441 start_codon:yes stop_codon:yes gene_type:complete
MTDKKFLQESKKIKNKFLRIIKSEVLRNFDNEVQADGKTKWKPLEDATKIDRMYKKYNPSHPILNRKSKLRNSIRMTFKNNTIFFSSKLDYAETHQKGSSNPQNGARPIPPRPFLDYPDSCSEGGKLYKKHYEKPMLDLIQKKFYK